MTGIKEMQLSFRNVLYNQAVNPLRMVHGDPEPYGAAEVLHVHDEVLKPDPGDETFHHLSE